MIESEPPALDIFEGCPPPPTESYVATVRDMLEILTRIRSITEDGDKICLGRFLIAKIKI